MFTQFSAFLLRTQEWFVHFEFANPWTDPWWALEDLWLILTWLAEDYLYISPVFWLGKYIFLAYSLAYIFMRVRRDYFEYLALGRGSQLPNVWGWLRHKFLAFFILRIMRFDFFSVPFIHPYMEPYNGQLLNMPQRGRPRPTILGVGPLKQQSDGNPRVQGQIMQFFLNLAMARPDLFQIGLSARTGLAMLKRNLPFVDRRATFGTGREWDDEIAYVRPDGSMTVSLHPADAAEVIQRGWGQRSPLAAIDSVLIWRLFYHYVLRTSTPLPFNSVIVYAPLDDAETDVVARIVAAGIWWSAIMEL